MEISATPIDKTIAPAFSLRVRSCACADFFTGVTNCKKVGGRGGARLFPFVEYSELGLSSALNKELAILDTFDMYSPWYDTPQTLRTVQQWFEESGLTDIDVHYGPNGIVGKGKKSTL